MLWAEATPQSFGVWVALQTTLAWWLFAPAESPLPGVLRRVVPPRLGKESFKNIVARYRTSDETVTDERAVDRWMETWFCFSINHGMGGFLMMCGILSGNAAIWRAGLTFETGEDICHFIQIALSFVGLGPAVAWANSRKIVLALHHSLGLLAGVPAYFILADNYDVQIMCFMLLGAPVPGMALEGALYMFDQTRPGWPVTFSIVLSALNLVWWIHCRWIVFVPTVAKVLPTIWREQSGTITFCMGFSICCFVIFNVGSTIALAHSFYGMLKALGSSWTDGEPEQQSNQAPVATTLLEHTSELRSQAKRRSSLLSDGLGTLLTGDAMESLMAKSD